MIRWLIRMEDRLEELAERDMVAAAGLVMIHLGFFAIIGLVLML